MFQVVFLFKNTYIVVDDVKKELLKKKNFWTARILIPTSRNAENKI